MGLCDTLVGYATFPAIAAYRKENPGFEASLKDCLKLRPLDTAFAAWYNAVDAAVTGTLAVSAMYLASEGNLGLAALCAVEAAVAHKVFGKMADSVTLVAHEKAAVDLYTQRMIQEERDKL